MRFNIVPARELVLFGAGRRQRVFAKKIAKLHYGVIDFGHGRAPANEHDIRGREHENLPLELLYQVFEGVRGYANMMFAPVFRF